MVSFGMLMISDVSLSVLPLSQKKEVDLKAFSSEQTGLGFSL